MKQVVQWFKKHQIITHLLIQSQLSGLVSFNKKKIDLIVVLGGDGTYLNAVHFFSAASSIPFLGINIGSLGFLTVHRQKFLENYLESAIQGKMAEEKRALLDIEVKKSHQVINRYIALNDLVIERGSFSHLISISIAIQNQNIYSIRGDGLIVSSPTGSTAYNLAAGGPILHPQVNALAITPICSHSLTHRPVIVPNHCAISFRLDHPNPVAFLTVDGQKKMSISNENQMTVNQSQMQHKTLRDKKYNYFLLLKDKLKFSQ